MGLDREAVRKNLAKSFVREERATILQEAKDTKCDLKEAGKDLQKLQRRLWRLDDTKFVQRQAQKLLREKDQQISNFNFSIKGWEFMGLAMPFVMTVVGGLGIGTATGAMVGLVAGLVGSALCALGAIHNANKQKHLNAELKKLERSS